MKTPYVVVALFISAALCCALIDQRPDVASKVEAGFQLKRTAEEELHDREAVHVIYWEKWNGFEGEAMQACVDRFNEHSRDALKSTDDKYRYRFLSPEGKRIIVHMLSTTHVNRKTLMAVSGGIPPDVAGLWSRDVPDFAQYEAALPLDDWLKRDGPDAEEYYKCYWDMCVYQGRVWSLLTTPASVALHWNKELFEKAGLDPEVPPKSLEELDEFSKKLTIRDDKNRVVQMGFLPTEPGWWNYAWGNWFGALHASEDGRTLTCDGKKWIEAYTWLNEMAEFYGRTEVVSFRQGLGNFDSPQNAFIDGKVAMVIQGVWMANFIRRYKPSMQWGAAPFPGPGGTLKDPVTIAQADVLVIPRGCAHPEEAWKFVRYVNSHGDPDDPNAPIDGMEILCLAQGKHTPFKRTTRAFLTQHRHEHLQVFMDLAASKNAIIEPMMPMWKEYRLALKASFDSMWMNGDKEGYGPEDVLTELKERLQPKLDRAWEKIDALGKKK